jgi:hypothetical protein
MDHDYRERKRQGTPSKQSDRDKAQALRDWIDAALAHYERQGGTRGIVVRKSPPPGSRRRWPTTCSCTPRGRTTCGRGSPSEPAGPAATCAVAVFFSSAACCRGRSSAGAGPAFVE